MRILLLALVLGGCQIDAPSVSVAPAPLAVKVIDDVALRTAVQSFDVALDGIALLRERGLIKVGSPRAVGIAKGINRVSEALVVADHAVKAGSTTSYAEALHEAGLAIQQLRSALKGN